MYARRQKLSEEAIAYATAVKVDAMTLMGEFLEEAAKANGGDAQRTRFNKGTESPPTLAEIGIGKKESSDAQALAEHMEEFVKVGLALKEIRDDKLYQEDGFKTFEDYCRKRWDISKSHASNVISSAELRLVLPSFPRENSGEGMAAADTEWTEKSVREVKRLKSPTKAKAVAERVVKEVKEKKARGEKVKLGSVVRKHVDQALGVGRRAPTDMCLARAKDRAETAQSTLRW